jgi:hypothetical protein
VKIHCALGQFGLGDDVVKADLLAGESALLSVVSVIVGPPSNAPPREFDNRPIGLEALFVFV